MTDWKKHLNVLVTIKSKYRKQLCVMLYSLRLHCKTEAIDVYLINKSLSVEELVQIEEYINNKCKMKLHAISLREDAFWEQMPLGAQHFSIEMYFRILAPYILPGEMERILWLDADIVINGDITSFYYQDFEENCMIVCMDRACDSDEVNVFRRVKGKSDIPYFNSGVLLMPDQDILNLLYRDKVKFADEDVYNYQKKDGWIHKLEKKPYIIHYIGGSKPWMWGYYWSLCRSILDYPVKAASLH